MGYRKRIPLATTMTEATGAPADGEALWRFSVAFYARPGVSEALIALQDRAGCDVNLMLFALWLGVSRCGRLTKKELTAAARIARPIRVDIVEPLQALNILVRMGLEHAPQRPQRLDDVHPDRTSDASGGRQLLFR